MKNCDLDDCKNPKCPSHHHVQLPLFPDKKPEFVEIDTFPAKGDTFEPFIKDVTDKVIKGFKL